MKLRIRAFALTTGIIFGLLIFLITNIFVILDYSGETLVKLDRLLFGYQLSFSGSLIGTGWVLIYGIIGGGIFAWLYNFFTGVFKSRVDQ